jgi:hypothetical protein
MTDDEKRKTIERLQAQARAQWPHPRPISLDGPGPFLLPLCGHVSALGVGSDQSFVLLLETAKGDQPIHIPISTDELPGLAGIVDLLFQQYAASVAKKPKN